jgi:hypothetical protein
MADPNDGKLWKDDKLWEIRSKGFNYLLVAHAAGLIAYLTVLKDYDTNPALKRLGSFIWIFGFGLMGAILGVVVLITARQGELVHGRNMHGEAVSRVLQPGIYCTSVRRLDRGNLEIRQAVVSDRPT